jgi:hypothetical protein
MAWVRIHDGAMTHPKIVGLSDKAFRLWIWGLSYCQQHLTDGVIPAVAINGSTKVATLLVLAHLWDANDGGWTVHDYLDWNDSRELVKRKRLEAKERMTNARQKRSREQLAENDVSRSTLGRVGEGSDRSLERESEGKPSAAESVIDAFRAHWQRCYGFECSLILKPFEFMQLEQQLGKVSVDQLLDALGAYFETQDPYILKARHPLPLFLRDPLMYLAKAAPAAHAGKLTTRLAVALETIKREAQ